MKSRRKCEVEATYTRCGVNVGGVEANDATTPPFRAVSAAINITTDVSMRGTLITFAFDESFITFRQD
jgi:hypothetical protein